MCTHDWFCCVFFFRGLFKKIWGILSTYVMFMANNLIFFSIITSWNKCILTNRFHRLTWHINVPNNIGKNKKRSIFQFISQLLYCISLWQNWREVLTFWQYFVPPAPRKLHLWLTYYGKRLTPIMIGIRYNTESAQEDFCNNYVYYKFASTHDLFRSHWASQAVSANLEQEKQKQ